MFVASLAAHLPPGASDVSAENYNLLKEEALPDWILRNPMQKELKESV